MTQLTLDKYRILALLGRGGMADVYLAVVAGPAGFSKLFVLKVLEGKLARDPRFRAMFEDEGRLAARLNHPNIVQTYEVGVSEGRHYIAMEYLEGQPLSRVSEALSRARGLSPSWALGVAVEALNGLEYAHELQDFDGRRLGIVHRDITPQNVFVTYEGQVKIVDFGIAKALDSSSETTIGTVKGKVAYMAPEQARGERVDRRADLFSVGVVVWELLAGRRLWEGLTDVAVVGSLVHGEIPDLARVRSDLPEGLAPAVMRALDPDPSRRHQDAAELRGALEEVLERLPDRASQRRRGELLRLEFESDRARVRAVVQKQLERLARDSSPGVPSSRRPALSTGAPPILGEGHQVHDAVTALHTGFTMAGSAPPEAVTATSQPLRSGTTSAEVVTGVTDVQLLQQTRRTLWVAVGAVAIAGLSLGVAQPWRQLLSSTTSPRTPAPAARAATVAVVEPAERRQSARPAGCNAKEKPLVELSGDITEDAELSCTSDYLLRFTTFVTPGATLRIEPGTRILGDRETKGTLVIQPGARILAAGAPGAPIVFTSDQPEGLRRPGDWGGVLLLGEAPLNLVSAAGEPMRGRVEGISSGGEYGGSRSDDSSGVLSYVRIEYSGTKVGPNNEINGLTLAGVGRRTVIDHVEVRRTADDCFEFFGGTVDAKYLVCSQPDDDAFDWDYGYQGRLQFIVAQAAGELTDGAHGIEGDNDPNGTKNAPVSAPLVYNATLCGRNRSSTGEEHFGALLRRGTEGRIRNALFTGFSAGLDVRDPGTKPNIAASVFFGNLLANLAHAETPAASRTDRFLHDDDAAFDELNYLTNAGLKISELDPHLGNCFDLNNPDFKPVRVLAVGAAIPPDDGFFDVSAQYIGAFRDRDDAWDAGSWVRFGD